MISVSEPQTIGQIGFQGRRPCDRVLLTMEPGELGTHREPQEPVRPLRSTGRLPIRLFQQRDGRVVTASGSLSSDQLPADSRALTLKV
jgi:hypothetical protein